MPGQMLPELRDREGMVAGIFSRVEQRPNELLSLALH